MSNGNAGSKGKSKTQSGKQVAEQKQAGLPAGVEELEQHAGEGFEQADADSYAIPFVQILQSNSPQVKRSEGAYVQGAAEGMVINTVSNDLYNADDEGITVVPVDYRRAFTAWVPRDHGGGFRGEVDVNDDVLRNTTRVGAKLWNEETGLEYVDTRYHYVLVIRSDGEVEPALITMSSTQLKKSRNIMTRLNNSKLPSGKTAPMYANVITLHTTPEQNDQGSWFGWKPDFQSMRFLNLDDEGEHAIFGAAKQFRDQLRAGQVKEAAPDQDAVGGDDAAASQY